MIECKRQIGSWWRSESMEKQEYIEEVNLIKEQNDTEFEIYPMAVEIIRPTIKNLSKRYVFARRKTDKGQIYYGISSFPDVAILDKKFKNISNKTISEEVWHQLKGCLEVKALETKLITKDQIEEVLSTKPDKLKKEIGQLIGEILWYKKVLYTNGVEWRCLYINEYSEELIKRIIGMVNERIDSEKENPNKDFDWWEKFKDIEFKIVDECITKNCIENWDDFYCKNS